LCAERRRAEREHDHQFVQQFHVFSGIKRERWQQPVSGSRSSANGSTGAASRDAAAADCFPVESYAVENRIGTYNACGLSPKRTNARRVPSEMNAPRGFRPLFRTSPVLDLIGPVYSRGGAN
jgi:hypothetical protein